MIGPEGIGDLDDVAQDVTRAVAKYSGCGAAGLRSLPGGGGAGLSLDVDRPKNSNSCRKVALSSDVQRDMRLWLEASPGRPGDWLFSCENFTIPIAAENMMARYIRPKLKTVDLRWADYRAFRRTHSSLMNANGVDPKVIADQQGHTVDVNLNVHRQTSIERRRKAGVSIFELG